MFQWDAVDFSPDLWGQNVLKTFEMAIRHNRRTTRTELESFLALDLLSLTFKNIFLVLLRGGRSPPWIRHWSAAELWFSRLAEPCVVLRCVACVTLSHVALRSSINAASVEKKLDAGQSP